MIHNIHILLLCLFTSNLLVSAQSFVSTNSSIQPSFLSSISLSSIPSSSSLFPSSSSIRSSSSFSRSSIRSSSSSLFSSSVLANTTSLAPVVPVITTSNTTSSFITPTFTSSNISTLPTTSASTTLTTQSSSSSSSSSTSSSSSSTRSTTSFESTSVQETTTASLSTYTSNGQVLVTQVFLTLTSTHTSFSTRPPKQTGLSSKNKKIVLGVVVGVGLPFIILAIWLVYFFMLKGKKERYIDSQGREVIGIKHNKFVRYVWCDLFGFSFKDNADSVHNKSTSSFRSSSNFMNRGGSKTSSNYNNSNLGVLGNNVMQMNDKRLEQENELLKQQREKGFPTNDNSKESHLDSPYSPTSLQDDHNGRDIDGNFKGRNSLNTHRRIESIVTADGFDYLDEINAKKY